MLFVCFIICAEKCAIKTISDRCLVMSSFCVGASLARAREELEERKNWHGMMMQLVHAFESRPRVERKAAVMWILTMRGQIFIGSGMSGPDIVRFHIISNDTFA